MDTIDHLEQEESTELENQQPMDPTLKWLAHIISAIFHPFLVPVYALLFINYFNPYQFAHLSDITKFYLLMSVIFNTLVFPAVTVFLMRQLDFIKSFQMRGRKERIIPFIAISLFYFWSYLVVKNFGVGSYFTHVMLGGSLSIFMAFFLNNYYKISVHSVGAGNFVAIAFTLTMISNYNLTLPLMMVIMVAGLVGSARLYLGAHIQSDVYSGYMVGLLGQLIAFSFF